MLLSHSFSPTPFLTWRRNLFYWQNGYQFHIGTYASLSFGTNKTGLPDGFSDKALIPTIKTIKVQDFYCELFFSNMPSKVRLTKMFMVPLLQAGFMALLMSYRRYPDKYRYTFSANLKQYIQSLLITLWKISLYIFDSYSNTYQKSST